MNSSPRRQDLQVVLEAALAANIGLLLRTNDPTKLRMALYAARREAGRLEFDQLQFRLSPFEGEPGLVVCKVGAGGASRPGPPINDLFAEEPPA